MGFFFTLCKIENLKRKDKNETEDDTIKKDFEKLKKVWNCFNYIKVYYFFFVKAWWWIRGRNEMCDLFRLHIPMCHTYWLPS